MCANYLPRVAVRARGYGSAGQLQCISLRRNCGPPKIIPLCMMVSCAMHCMDHTPSQSRFICCIFVLYVEQFKWRIRKS